MFHSSVSSFIEAECGVVVAESHSQLIPPRFMATNDLMLELQKDSIKLDEDSERKVVDMLLRLLEDKNGEVQNLAVKW